MINTISSRNGDSAGTWSKTMPTAAYVHIPFCRRRCYYCDFPISVVGDKGRSASTMIEDYLAALIKDIQLTFADRQPLKTVFFGGGTPSLLSPAQLEQIILAIAYSDIWLLE